MMDDVLRRAWETPALCGKMLFIHSDEAGAVDAQTMRRLRSQLMHTLAAWCADYCTNATQAFPESTST